MKPMFFNAAFREAVKNSELKPLGSAAVAARNLTIILNEMTHSTWILSEGERGKLSGLKKKVDQLCEAFYDYTVADPQALSLMVDYLTVSKDGFQRSFAKTEIADLQRRLKALPRAKPEALEATRRQTLTKIRKLSTEISQEINDAFKAFYSELIVEGEKAESEITGRKLTAAESTALRASFREYLNKVDGSMPMGSVTRQLIHNALQEGEPVTEETGTFPHLIQLRDDVSGMLVERTQVDIDNMFYHDATKRSILGTSGKENMFDDIEQKARASGHPNYVKAITDYSLMVDCAYDAHLIQTALEKVAITPAGREQLAR
jgi:hypothetical protein